jgi:aspartyl-tRNA synthetase
MPQIYLIKRPGKHASKWRVFTKMESIHKSKAEKAREKILSDQFDMIINVSLRFSKHSTTMA